MSENDPQPEAKAEADGAVESGIVAASLGAIEKAPEISAADETTSKLVEADEENIFVAASTLEEMNLAQKNLIIWSGKKIEKLMGEVKAAEDNLEIAKKRKWGTDSFKRIVAVAQKKVDFYSKVRAALEAGYTIIPDMPMDIFAIRTTAKNPRRNDTSTSTQYGSRAIPSDQITNNPALGAGKFVSPQAFVETRKFEGQDRDKKPVPMEKAWAVEFDEAIDFPFKLAKPSVLNATAKALGQKFFDVLGAAPSRNAARKGDPMVIGRIFVKHGWHEKGISFLVSWFVDSKDL